MRTLFAVLLLAGMALAPARAKIVYVDRDAPGPAHDGTTWATAFTSFTAGAVAAYAGDEVWVAEGVYNTFPVSLRASVGYYGGFAGTETAREAADPEQHPTVLDAGRRPSLLNASATVGRDTVLDGFTLRNTYSGNYQALGGGLVVTGGSPTVRNCAFSGHEAYYYGAVTARGGAPLFENCEIQNNLGYAAYVFQRAALVLNGCMISDNWASLAIESASATVSSCTIIGNGGPGISAYQSTVTVELCEVRGNQGYGILLSDCPEATVVANRILGNDGGGVVLDATPALVMGNLIVDNTGRGWNAGILVGTGAPVLANNTIAGHTGPYGAGISIYTGSGGSSSPPATPIIRNNILAFNESAVRNDDYVPGQPALSHNCAWGNVQDYVHLPDPTGTDGNIRQDPRLVQPDDGNFHIQPTSPCRDAGDASGLPDGTDMDLQPRVQGSSVDIGADESDGTTWPAATRVIRVRTGGDDAKDGSTWALAKRTVGGAFAAMQAEGGEVWVADGTYPGRLTMPPFVRLYGGFAGTETARRTYPEGLFASNTVLDGGARPSTGVGILSSGPGATHGSVLTIGPGGVRCAVEGFVLRNGFADRGAGLMIRSGSNARVWHNTVRDNTAASLDPYSRSAGGGVFAFTAAADLRHNLVTGNRASRGAGIFLGLGEFTVIGNTISTNEAVAETVGESAEPGGGGGLRVHYLEATVTDNVFDGNRAAYGAGFLADCLNSPGSAVSRNTFRGNVAATSGGGALFGLIGPGTFTDNVLTGNRAGEKGGGLIAVGGKILNNTFTDNDAPEGGAAYIWLSPYLVANNIIAFNSSGFAVHDEAGWVWPDPEPLRAYNNLFFANAGGDFAGPPAVIDTTLIQGNLHADPLFADRANGDLHSRAGSPAIDAGVDIYVQPADTDRDGRPRIQGRHVDLGAYETPGTAGYRWWDVLRALRLSGGLDVATSADMRLNLAGNPRLPWDITMSDAARLARKASGLEP